MSGQGSIFTSSDHDNEWVAERLKPRRIEVEPYTKRTGASRLVLEQSLLSKQVKVKVAIAALRMGFDKPDLGFVIQ